MIDIVIATYNPNHFFDEQIDSILAQSRQNLIKRIIITDDSESISEVVERNLLKDIRIEYHKNVSGKSGPVFNFENGLNLTTSDWIMTCDQDDVWFTDKIEKSVSVIQDIDNIDCPVLIGTNSMLCDADGISLGITFTNAKKIIPSEISDSEVLFTNYVPGCTMLFNRRLLLVSIPINSEAIMHDWWLLLNCICKGEFIYLNEPTMLYRQHEDNVIGAKVRTVYEIFFSGSLKLALNNYSDLFDRIVTQVSHLDVNCSKKGIAEIIEDAKSYPSLSKVNRLKFIMKYCKAGFVRKLAFFIFSLVSSR